MTIEDLSKIYYALIIAFGKSEAKKIFKKILKKIKL